MASGKQVSLSAAVAAPIVKVIGETEWSFSPLTIRAFGELEQWARSKVIEAARDAIQGADDTTASRVMREAFNMATQISFMATQGKNKEARAASQSILSSVDGVVKVCMLSLRKRHPEITADKVEELLMREEVDANGLVNDIMRISGQSTFRIQEVPVRQGR